MSRLRVRTPSGAWLDICESEWYVRDSKNLNWIRLVVSKEMKVRHGSNAYWLNIECDIDDIYCPPDEVLECWPGAAGLFDSGIIVDGGPTGSQLCDCDGKNCVTYIGPGPSGEGKGNSGLNSGGQLLATSATDVLNGSKENPLPCPVTAYGGRAAITEFYVDVSQISGMVTLNARSIVQGSRFRVYKDCDLLADSALVEPVIRNGIKAYVLKFLNDTILGTGRVLVRVDGQTDNALWEIGLSCPNQDPDFSVVKPAPCYGTYHAIIGCTAYAYERIHKLDGSGLTWLDITVGREPIRVSVFYQGQMIANTGDAATGFITQSVQLSWNFTPRNNDDEIVIRVERKTPTNEWDYSIYCPNTTGSLNNPDHCSGGGIPATCADIKKPAPVQFWRQSNGADITDTWYDLSKSPYDGKVYIDYVFEGTPAGQVLVYDEKGQMLAASVPETQSGKLVFDYYHKNTTLVRVRVIGTCCPKWSFGLTCPIPIPTISIGDVTITRGPYGTVTQMCYPVTLSHIFDEYVTVNYRTQSFDSEPSTDCVQRVSERFPFTVVPKVDSIFQSWPRTDGNVYYPANSVWAGNSKSWSFKSDRVITSINSSTLIGFVSPDAFNDFSCECIVGSADSDNDVMGAIAAFKRTPDGVNHYIVVIRHRGGLGPTGTITNAGWNQNFVMAYATGAPTHMSIVKILGSHAVGGNGGWSGVFTRIWFERDGTAFRAKCSTWSSDTLLEETLIQYDMGQDAQLLGLFAGKCPFGFFSLSQAGGYFGSIEIRTRTDFSDTYPVSDYKPISDGVLELAPCQTTGQICIPVCGTDRVGPTRYLDVILSNPQNATIADGVGHGTILNPNTYDHCIQPTQIAVHDGGPCEFVQNGARKMFVQDNIAAANFGFSATMDMYIDIAVAGTYTFAMHGDDDAQLYVDCDLVLTTVGRASFYAVGVRYYLPVGRHYMFLHYVNTVGPQRNPSYASMAILRGDGSVLYASNAADWRSYITDPGTPPACRQFPPTCSVNPTVAVIISPSLNDTNIGYPAQRIQSAAHSVNCAPGGTYYVMERKMTFPVSGIYTWRATADDNFWFYIDCNLVGTGNNWNGAFGGTFYVEAGEHELTLMYQNVPNCTPGWAKLALLSPGGAPFYYSDAAGWLSMQGNLAGLGSPMYAEGTGDAGARTIAQYGALPIRAGWRPNYAWFTAELLWNCPADGNYRIVASADDNVQIFMDCASVVYTPSLNWATWSEYFFLSAGVTNIVARCFNQQSKRPNYFIFAIINEAGQVVYATNPTGWKARAGDVDWSGLV